MMDRRCEIALSCKLCSRRCSTWCIFNRVFCAGVLYGYTGYL